MAANIKFTIDGKPLSELSGVDGFSLLYAIDQDTGTVQASASSDLVLYDDDFERIRDVFFNGCNGREIRVDATVQSSCVGALEGFEITPGGVELSPSDCSATVAMSKKEYKGCLLELKDTVFHKKGFDEAVESGEIKIPKVYYCIAHAPMLAAILWFLRITLFPILAIFEVIENAVNLIPGVNINIPFSLDDFDNLLTGCSRYHHAPMVKDVIEFHTARCGLGFKSSILVDDPVYQNIGLMEMLVEKGTRYVDNNKYNFNNSTNFTVGQILDLMSKVFNAEYRIIDDNLIFERSDYFDDRRDDELVNVEAAFPSCMDKAASYSFNLQSAKAYFRGEYKRDNSDAQGNRMKNLGYFDLVEWNDPPQPIGEEWQTGEFTVNLELGGVRNMFDRITCGKDDGQDFIDFQMDKFRQNSSSSPGFKRSRAVLMEKHTAQYPKLLCFEQGFDYDDALIIRREANTKNSWQCYDYNFPLYFNENYDIPELYQSFHFIEDPRRPDVKRDYYQIASITYAPEDFCADALKIHNNFHDIYIQTAFGRGYSEEFEIDFDNCLITINDIRIPCLTT